MALTETEQDTFGRLLSTVGSAHLEVDRLDNYYQGVQRLAQLGLAVPPDLRGFVTVVNWPRLVVDAVEERLDVEGLRVRFGDDVVLDGVDLHLRRGDVVVITGPVAAGKSTLLRALLGLPNAADVSGSVRWNDVELDDRAAFMVPPNAAFLPQVPQLISDSLADNIALGALPVDDVEAAIELAELTEDLSDMSEGTGTMIGPRGLRLSGGQRQRLAAARAIVRRPEILVLDDLSSALDVETERRLWTRFADAGLTVIAVSHRTIAFEQATTVLRLADGRLHPVASGDR